MNNSLNIIGSLRPSFLVKAHPARLHEAYHSLSAANKRIGHFTRSLSCRLRGEARPMLRTVPDSRFQIPGVSGGELPGTWNLEFGTWKRGGQLEARDLVKCAAHMARLRQDEVCDSRLVGDE